jgi:hypothetical protein
MKQEILLAQSNPSPTRILKARKNFLSLISQLRQNRFSNRIDVGSTAFQSHSLKLIDVGVCYCLFEYLSSGLDAARSSFDEIINFVLEEEKLNEQKFKQSTFLPQSLLLEQIFEAYARLLISHSLKFPTPPGLLREVLLRALSFFPTNAFFLFQFIESEVRSQIAGRLRFFFDEVCEKYASPLLWLMAIHTETTRLGASARIQSLFERALEDSRSRHSIALWRYYLLYELQQTRPESAKGVFYRAIRDVPWSKALWLDSIRMLVVHVNLSEFHDILKLMTEKEIRIRKLPDTDED